MPGTYRQGPFEFALDRSDVSFADWQFHHHSLGSFTGMVFSARPTTIDVFAPRNVHLSTSPESGFVKTLTAQRRDADGIDILRGQVLTRVESTFGPDERWRPAPSGSGRSPRCSTFHSTTRRPSNTTRCGNGSTRSTWHGRRRRHHRRLDPHRARVDEVGERDGWRCWLCDEPVDPSMSVNDPRGPSIDSRISDARQEEPRRAGPTRRRAPRPSRLQHPQGCGDRGGAVARRPVRGRPGADHRRGRAAAAQGRPRADGPMPTRATPTRPRRGWSIASRGLAPGSGLTTEMDAGGGQFLLLLRT